MRAEDHEWRRGHQPAVHDQHPGQGGEGNAGGEVHGQRGGHRALLQGRGLHDEAERLARNSAQDGRQRHQELLAAGARVARPDRHHRHGLPRPEDRHHLPEGRQQQHRLLRPQRQGRRLLLDHRREQDLQAADGVRLLPRLVGPRHGPDRQGLLPRLQQRVEHLAGEAGDPEALPLRRGDLRHAASHQVRVQRLQDGHRRRQGR
mmetsp:Transcript_993/g.3537  ORF Transcript_993/g.3537 Transcript_993/m.3537 type:complete len:204 (+) Transcript_993:183-794(+)